MVPRKFRSYLYRHPRLSLLTAILSLLGLYLMFSVYLPAATAGHHHMDHLRHAASGTHPGGARVKLEKAMEKDTHGGRRRSGQNSLLLIDDQLRLLDSNKPLYGNQSKSNWDKAKGDLISGNKKQSKDDLPNGKREQKMDRLKHGKGVIKGRNMVGVRTGNLKQGMV